MPRQSIISNLTVQFPNNIQPPQWGAPVLITQICVITDANGNALYQPSYQAMPASAEDISDEMLAALQQQLAAVGLTVARTGAGPATATGEA